MHLLEVQQKMPLPFLLAALVLQACAGGSTRWLHCCWQEHLLH